jgi:hypothetical protein
VHLHRRTCLWASAGMCVWAYWRGRIWSGSNRRAGALPAWSSRPLRMESNRAGFVLRSSSKCRRVLGGRGTRSAARRTGLPAPRPAP